MHSYTSPFAGHVPPVADVVVAADVDVTLIAFYMRGAHDPHAVMPLHDHPGVFMNCAHLCISSFAYRHAWHYSRDSGASATTQLHNRQI